jgi:endoglucanase
LTLITDIANVYKIPYQYKKTISGGTDAGRVQANGTGVKVATIAAPCRYIHSPVSVIDIRDFDDMLKLAGAVLKTLPVTGSSGRLINTVEGPVEINLYREQGGKNYV